MPEFSTSSSLPPVLRPAHVLLDGLTRPPEFVIKPYFPRGELTEIVGAHGVFKSTIALGACLAVATGRAWGGVPTAAGRTVFISLEDSEHTLARRLKAWLEGIEDRDERLSAAREIDANFTYLAREHARGLVMTRTVQGSTTPDIDVARHLAQLTRGTAIVVLETVSRIHDGPETNDAFSALVKALETIAENGTALVIVRHMSKKAAREMKGPDTIDSYGGRGGGALSDAVRSCLVVTRHDGAGLGHVTLRAVKTTHARPGDSISWVPVVVPHLEAVRLEDREPEREASDEATALHGALVAAGRGITKTDLHKHPPAGLTRTAAKECMAYLLRAGLAVQRQERRGTNPATIVYYAAERLLEAA